MSENVIREIPRNGASGYLALILIPVLILTDVWALINALRAESIILLILTVIVLAILVVCLGGFFMVHPNQARVLTLFGTYVGSARETGLRWANPFFAKKTVSLRVRNFDCDTLKVNDSSGNR